MGAPEPYRMFTARAEFRISMRPDNADLRLTHKGNEIGLVSSERNAKTETLRTSLEDAIAVLKSIVKPTSQWQSIVKEYNVRISAQTKRSAFDVLAMEGVEGDLFFNALKDELPSNFNDNVEACRRVKLEAMYSHAVEQQNAEIFQLRKETQLRFPKNFDFSDPRISLSNEEKEKLMEASPDDIASASRIPGVTPATVIRLMHFLKRNPSPEHVPNL